MNTAFALSYPNLWKLWKRIETINMLVRKSFKDYYEDEEPRKKPKTDLNSKNNLPNNFFPFVGKTSRMKSTSWRTARKGS